MNILDYLTSPWCIVPDKLLEIQSIYTVHLRGDKIDIDAIEARLGRPLANEQQEYMMREGGVAVLPISGVISNKANMFSRISGGASAQLLQKQVDSMAADPRVRAVVIDMDSPGGSVLGIPALAESIRALAAEKPTVTVCTGTMASAGYWLGSSANAVYISGLTDYVGSIGVVAVHNYNPRAAGQQTTEITAGRYKRMASDSAPLTAEGKEYLQQQVDAIYSVFVDTVAKNRQVDPAAVLEKMADGRIFIGQQAIDAGLVDGVATVDAMVERLATNPDQYATRRKATFAGPVSASAAAGVAEADAQITDEPVLPVDVQTIPKGNVMTPQELVAQFEAEHPEAAALIRTAGASAERDRIASVREQSMPGHEALVEALAFDGKTTGPEAAVQILAAERSRLAAAGNARDDDAPAPVATESAEEAEAAAPSGDVMTDRAKQDAAAKAYMKAHPGVDYVAAFKAISQGV